MNETPINEPPTAVQIATLVFVAAYVKREGHAPAARDIAMHFRIATSNAQNRVRSLARRGLLERKGQIARTLRLTEAGLRFLADRKDGAT